MLKLKVGADVESDIRRLDRSPASRPATGRASPSTPTSDGASARRSSGWSRSPSSIRTGSRSRPRPTTSSATARSATRCARSGSPPASTCRTGSSSSSCCRPRRSTSCRSTPAASAASTRTSPSCCSPRSSACRCARTPAASVCARWCSTSRCSTSSRSAARRRAGGSSTSTTCTSTSPTRSSSSGGRYRAPTTPGGGARLLDALDRRVPVPGRPGVGAGRVVTRRIDAHHHVWDLAVRDQPWIGGDAMAPIRRSFGDRRPRAPTLAASGDRATVVVQTVADVDRDRGAARPRRGDARSSPASSATSTSRRPTSAISSTGC